MDITKQLFSRQDVSYREFQSALMPTVPKDTVIGVRTPEIRALAKQLSGTREAEMFLKNLPHRYYEENNLHACLLEKIPDFDACLGELQKFLPYLDNWATCDMLSPKILKTDLSRLCEECFSFLESGHTYTIRFGIKLLMTYFLDERFSAIYPERISKIHSEEYYVNMMIAWYFATALAKQYDSILPYLKEGKLSPWIHNKTIQKAVESRRITSCQKEYLKTLRITDKKVCDRRERDL